MSSKNLRIVALGTLAIGILVGFMAGALTLSNPRDFNSSRMLITWCVFGVASLIFLVVSATVKDQEPEAEQNTEENNQIAIENNHIATENNHITTSPYQQPNPEESKIHCANCGHEIEPGEDICMNCGTIVENN